MRRLEANDRPSRRASGQARLRTAFLRRLRCGFSVVLWREQDNLAVEIKRQAGIPPRTWTPSPSVCFQSLLRRVELFLPAVLPAFLPLHEDREQGRHGLLSLSVPFAHATRPLVLPAHTARRDTRTGFFLFRTSTEKVRSPNFSACAPHGLSPQGLGPLRCGCCSLKHKIRVPPNFFR